MLTPVSHSCASCLVLPHQDAEDALEFAGAASDGEAESTGAQASGKGEEEEEGPDLRDELDADESPRKGKSKKRQRPGAGKKQGGTKRARTAKTDYESDDDAGISVIKHGSPVRDPSSKYDKSPPPRLPTAPPACSGTRSGLTRGGSVLIGSSRSSRSRQARPRRRTRSGYVIATTCGVRCAAPSRHVCPCSPDGHEDVHG